MIITCQGHQFLLQKRETAIFNMETTTNEPTQLEQSKWDTCFNSLGIIRQEVYMQESKRATSPMTYEVRVPSVQRARHLVRKLSKVLPEFLDNEDRIAIEDVINDSTMAAASKKRDVGVETEFEIQINYSFVQLSLVITY